MRCVVVYESMFGNTHDIADAVGQGLAHLGEVRVSSLAAVPPSALDGIDLLVVGGPTHVHGMTRPTSRRAAAEEAEKDDSIDLDPDALGPGLREWIATLKQSSGTLCAAFDTRIDKSPLLVGSAAKVINKRLKRLGYVEVAEPQSFFVDDSTGPLHEGEADRAREWGTRVAHELIRINRHRTGTSKTR